MDRTPQEASLFDIDDGRSMKPAACSRWPNIGAAFGISSRLETSRFLWYLEVASTQSIWRYFPGIRSPGKQIIVLALAIVLNRQIQLTAYRRISCISSCNFQSLAIAPACAASLRRSGSASWSPNSACFLCAAPDSLLLGLAAIAKPALAPLAAAARLDTRSLLR